MLMIFTLFSFATYIILLLLPKLSSVTFNDLRNLTAASPARTVKVSLVVNAFIHVGTFFTPAVLFASFTHPRVREYLGIRMPGKSLHWLWVTGIMLGLIPVFIWGETFLIKYIHLGTWASERQAEADKMLHTYLKLNTWPDFALLMVVLALIPAIGEELLFRGILLRLLHRRMYKILPAMKMNDAAVAQDVQRSMVFPVVTTALIFTFWHATPYAFVFIFIAGCVLALIYFLTGSLLCSMWGHILFNGIQVMSVFLANKNEAVGKIVEGENLPFIYPLLGLIVFIASFYALVRTQTPMSPNWSADFKPEEQ